MSNKSSNSETSKSQYSQITNPTGDSQSAKAYKYQVTGLAYFVDKSDIDADGTDLLVTMLGNFSIRQNDADEEVAIMSKLGGRSRRLWVLIAYLIINREKGVSASELIDLLWPDVDTSNPQTRLQNNISRARAVLDNGAFADSKDLIRFENGLYWWAPAKKTILDVDVFEEAVRRLGHDIEPSKIDLALEVCDLYQGDFLSQATDEAWCTNLNIYYRSLFTSFASRVLIALKKAERTTDIKKLCLKVIEIDPTIEEFNVALMEALIVDGSPSKAIDHYENLKTIFHDIYGVQVSPEIEVQRNVALEAMYGNKVSKKVIIEYFKDLDVDDGAFFCNTVTFREIIKLHVRMLERSGVSSQLLALQVNMPNQNNANIERNISNIKRLEQIIQKTLRSGDPFTKMGRDFFLILLPGATKENSEQVTHRIVEKYHNEYPFSKVTFKAWQVDLKEL